MGKISFRPEPENGFYLTLKARVQEHFRSNGISRYANKTAIFKMLLFTALFGGTYGAILFLPMSAPLFLFCWFAFGIFLMLSAMSIVHDAAHSAISRKRWVNELLLRYANLVGADGYMYKYKHTVSHHPYTNIHGVDIDLEQSGIVRVTPFTRNTRKHRYQFNYMKLLYPFYVLFWVLVRDFRYYNRKEIGLSEAHHAPVHWITLIGGKIFYFCYMLGVPAILLPVPFWLILCGFFLMQIGAGIVAMLALLANHVVEDSLFIQSGPQGRIDCSWGEHQLRTTDDYSPDSAVISFLFSGLNHHVAHHLFPRYCHVHYPVITRLVRETAAEFGLRYRYNSLPAALRSHFRLLRNLSHDNQSENGKYAA